MKHMQWNVPGKPLHYGSLNNPGIYVHPEAGKSNGQM